MFLWAVARSELAQPVALRVLCNVAPSAILFRAFLDAMQCRRLWQALFSLRRHGCGKRGKNFFLGVRFANDWNAGKVARQYITFAKARGKGKRHILLKEPRCNVERRFLAEINV